MSVETEEGVLDEPVQVADGVVEGQDGGAGGDGGGVAVDDGTSAGAQSGDADGGEVEAEVVVQIGDEKPEEEERAPSWVRELRVRNRKLEQENRQLRQQSNPAAALGAKPTLEDFEFDAPKFEAALSSWMERKRAQDEQEAATARQIQTQQQAWNTKVAAYGVAKSALNVPDFNDAEAVVIETLSEQQQAIIVKGAKNPALLVLALGKNPKKAKELAAITDPVEFAFRAADVENQLKVTKKSPPPPNDKQIGGAAPRTSGEAALDKLRAEAEKSGDYSKVVAYKRKLKQT